MPNNILKSSAGANNGRSNSANNMTTTSISHKNDTKSNVNTNVSANANANALSLPDKTSSLASIVTAKATTRTVTLSSTATSTSHGTGPKLSSNNDSHSANLHALASHRRDSSSISGSQNKRDTRKYQYAKPQALLKHARITNLMNSDANDTGDTEIKDCRNASHLLAYNEDGHLVSASLDALITHMVPTSEYYPENNFVFAFLLSARLFIRPHELLAQISHTWEQQQQEQQQQQDTDVVDEAHFSHLTVAASASPLLQRKTAAANTTIGVSTGAVYHIPHNEMNAIVDGHAVKQRTAIQLSAQNCIHLLAEWIETFPYDFRDERLMQQVRKLARKCVYIDNALGRQVSRILQLLVRRLTDLEQYETSLQTLAAADVNGSHQHQHYNTSAAAAAATVSSASHNTLMGGVIGSGSGTIGKTTAGGAQTHNNADSQKSAATNANLSQQAESNTHEVFGILDICASCAQLAHQLTAIELERLSHIGPEEFVQAFAKEYQHTIDGKSSNVGTGTATGMSTTHTVNNAATLNDMKKTRNLESYVEWFNRLSYLTASEIVKYPKKKQRVRVIEYWIETARECFNIGNFNSLMAIIAGLNLAPISRLKKTWSKVQSAKFSVLEHQMDPTSNFNSYRSTLKAAMWRSEGATEERERIIIPFFSLFVKDLYFLNEGCSNRLPNNHINFEKCSQLAKQVMEFNEWKKVTCPFEKLPNVIAMLQTCSVLNENTLSMASFECEPPENTEEKGRYKTVKAETKQQLLHQLQEQQQQQQHQHQP